MDFICSKEKLLENLNIVLRAVSNKTTIEILKCVFIEAKDGYFTLTANDLELGIETKPIECTVINSGNMCLEARLLSEIVRHLPDDKISFSLNSNGTVIIKSGKSEFKIISSQGNEFPILPIVAKNNKYEMSAYEFKNMIRQTIFSVSTDESKMVLTGELLDINNDIINIVAVDGFRVALRSARLLTEAIDSKVIVPAKALNEISKILTNDEEEKVMIYITDKHILFEINNYTIISRLIEGEFINYAQVFTEDFTTKFTVNVSNFIDCLERSSIIAKEVKKNPIKLNIKKDIMIVTSNNEMGTTYEELSIDMEGNQLEIAFNPRYLIDILKSIDETEATLYFTTNLSPCIIKGLDATNHKYLLLPLRARS